MLIPPETPADVRGPQLIREYDSDSEYSRSATQLAAEGWRPVAVRRRPRGPVDRTLNAIVVPFLPRRSDHTLVVTYASLPAAA